MQKIVMINIGVVKEIQINSVGQGEDWNIQRVTEMIAYQSTKTQVKKVG